MTYISIADFKHGVNRLRPQVAGLLGSLWNAVNCVISRGGDIEAAKKFVPEYALPSGTFGLAGINGVPYVFGTASLPAGLPAGIAYQQLTYTGAANIVKVHDARPFSAKMYVIAEFDDGDVRHFYGGVEVTEWQVIADAAWDYTTVAKLLAQKINERADVTAAATADQVVITADVPGTPFTLATATIDNANVGSSLPTAAITHLQTNIAPVAEVRAQATVTITAGTSSPGVNFISQITLGANALLAAPVDFVLDDDGTANAVALAITSAAVGGYSATSSGPVVTIMAPPDVGATVNGETPSIAAAGNVTASATALAGGVTAVAAQTQIDQVTINGTTPDTLDTWKITVNGDTYLSTGRSSTTGTLIHVFLERVWIPVGTVLYFCKLSDPTKWSTMAGVPSTDPGFIDTGQDSEGSDDIVSLAEHNDGTAVFSDTNIRIYVLDTDATAIKLFQTIENTGSIAAKVPLQHGSVQVYYLAMTGMSTLQSRLGSNFVVTADFATAIAPYLQDFIDVVGPTVTGNAHAVVEPVDGRYMLSISDKIFVLSIFPDSGVAGWTEIDLPFVVEEFARIGRRVYARAADVLYVYGGVAGDVYPVANEAPIDVETPFLAADDPAGFKNDGGFDMAGTGTWKVELRVDPNDTSKVTKAIYVSKITYPTGTINLSYDTTHVAAHLVCASGGKATLSSMAIHYDRGEAG